MPTMNPDDPRDAQRIVSAYLTVVEAHAEEDVYPASLEELPYPKETIRTAFETAVRALAAGDQLSAELREYLEVGYVSLADYVDGESVRLMREYARAGDELAADARLAREKVDTGPWRRLREQGRLAGETAKAISEEAARLREEFRSWHGEGREAAT